jgi:predicted nuclease with RNAse H fold
LDVAEVRVVETLPSSALVTYNAALATVSSNLRAEKGAKRHAADIARKQQAAVAVHSFEAVIEGSFADIEPVKL